MTSGDAQLTPEVIEAARQAFEAFTAGIAKATKTKNAKAIYSAITRATKAFNKVARQQ